ncbi:hypothetical protein EDD11_004130 [Mortierella claussenii]|nr:hypothetical protein EDD11_004130 [Mortierella claussenii]
MLTLATAIGLRRLLEKQMTKRKRSPLEYIVLAMLGCVLAATIKYPNRAFLTHARPDLKAKGRDAPGYPLVGNLPDIIKARNDPLQMLHDTLREYGDVISITLPFLGRAIIINRPDLMEYVLKTNFENYVKGDLFRWHLVDILGRGIFVSDSDEWRFHRKTASNLFTTKLYRSLVQGAFQSSANDLSRVLNAHIDFPSPRCKDNEMNPLNAIDLQAQFLKLTLDAFGKLTFGLDFQALAGQSPQGPAGRGGGGGEHSHEFGDAFDFLTSAADARLSNPLWWLTEKLMPGNWKRHWDAIGVLDNYAERAVRQRRTETAEEREMRARDLLDHFIGYKNDDGTMLTDRELRDVFVNFMV